MQARVSHVEFFYCQYRGLARSPLFSRSSRSLGWLCFVTLNQIILQNVDVVNFNPALARRVGVGRALCARNKRAVTRRGSGTAVDCSRASTGL